MATFQPQFKLSTPQGNKLSFVHLSASEELGRLFQFNVLAVADAKETIDLAAMLGESATVSVQMADGKSWRHFNGIVASAGLDGAQGKHIAYRLTLKPWVWTLTRRADTRIFQHQTVEQILREVFKNHTGAFEFDALGSLPNYPYCVQYRETDFNFVSRLMEAEGLYYYFLHEEGKHTLRIVNRGSAHKEFKGHEKLRFRETHADPTEEAAVSDWRSTFELQPSKVALTDYNFTAPKDSLLKDALTARSKRNEKLEIYDQPGEYEDPDHGARYAKLRMEEIDARHLRILAAATYRGVAVGHTFELIEHPAKSENTKHLVVSTHTEAHYSGYETGQGESSFSSRLSAMRASDTFRPQRTTPKPTVPGLQTAVVVGKEGDEIHTDMYGRVRVQFHWDRLGKSDENSSCWLRVASPSAGKAFGMISVPRVGQEVVVAFIEGDPDQPLIVGSVYNAVNLPPYLLPDHSAVSAWRTQTTKGEVRDSFNEFTIDDTKDAEFIRLHAQKDLLQIVKHDAHLQVDNDQFRKVAKNLTEEIGENVHRAMGRNVTESIKENLHQDVGKEIAIAAGEKFGLKAGQDASIDTGGAFSLKSAAAGDFKIGANLGVDAAANVHIKAGANLVLEAGGTLTIKAAMVNIEGSGPVSINGAVVKINSGGGGGGGGGASPKAPAKPGKPDKPKPLDDLVKKINDDLKRER